MGLLDDPDSCKRMITACYHFLKIHVLTSGTRKELLCLALGKLVVPGMSARYCKALMERHYWPVGKIFVFRAVDRVTVSR